MTGPNELLSPTPSWMRTDCGTLLIRRKVRDTEELETESSTAILAGTPANEPSKSRGAIVVKAMKTTLRTDHFVIVLLHRSDRDYSLRRSRGTTYLKSVLGIRKGCEIVFVMKKSAICVILSDLENLAGPHHKTFTIKNPLLK